LNIEDAILEKAAGLTGVTEKTTPARLGLEALIAQKSSRRSVKLSGTRSIVSSRVSLMLF
jgi:Bacterial antitoxin of type II TA system, VapB